MDVNKQGLRLKSKSASKPDYKPEATKRPKLTELVGLDNLLLNVVRDKEEDPTVEIVGEEVDRSEIQDGLHDYCVVEEEVVASTAPSTSRDVKTNDRNERVKRNRLMDLQLECLELKRYNMQMESLLLERQLNLPRSIYTENLRGGENVTRGTQTDVGGGNIKVFYISDNQSQRPNSEGAQHLFAFQGNLSN